MAYLTLFFIVLALVQSSKENIRAITSIGSSDVDDLTSETISELQISDDPDVDISGHGVEGSQNPSINIYTSTGGDKNRNRQMHTTISSPLLKSPQKRTEYAISEDPGRVIGLLAASSAPSMPISEAHDQKESDQHDETLIMETSGYFYSNEETSMGHTIFTADERNNESHPPVENKDILTGKSDVQSSADTTDLSKSPHLTKEERTGDHESGKHGLEPPRQYGVFKSIINHKVSRPEGPCARGLGGPCTVLTSPNGTNLLWDDMKRTLTFAWELHVFGSASLFILLAGIAVLGMAGASTLLHPLCDALNLANGLLLLTGVLRAVLLLLDPYGTRQILSRPVLAALHNMALQILLWVQVALTLVALRGTRLVLLPLKLQQPRMVGGLVVCHCTMLLLADLLSPPLSSAVPLLLQTLSVCWGLSFCIGVFIHSVSHSFLRTSVPQLGAPQMIETTRVRRVTAVCSVIGVLCCGLHMYSVLWLYGLLGNWRRFGWGWWLSQFWARILELAWAFSLLVLGSWIFWTPHRSRSRSCHGQGRHELSEGTKDRRRNSCWGTFLKNTRKEPFRKSEENWEDLMPNNWAMYKLCLSNNTARSYDDQSITIVSDHKTGPLLSSSCDSQGTILTHRVGGPCECILSLVEVDMYYPSPINLQRTIDNAFHHSHLAMGSLFTLPLPSWTHNVEGDIEDSDTKTVSLSNVGYRWALKTDSTSADPFQGEESMQSPRADQTPSPNTEHRVEEKNMNKSEISVTMHQEDWSESDDTEL